MTQNSLNTTLSGQTGTGNTVGSDSPSLTGQVDCGSANTFKINSAASPVFSNTGEISLDTGITDYNTQLSYYDGTNNAIAPAVLTSDLDSTDRNVVVYDALNNKFDLQNVTPPTPAGLIQYVTSVSNVDDTTTSTVFVDTSLSVTITPTSATNAIIVVAHGAAFCQRNSGTIDQRSGRFRVIRSGGPSDLGYYEFGRILQVNSLLALPSYAPIGILTREVPGVTTPITYILQFSSFLNSGVITSLNGGYSFMIAMEITP